MLDRKDMMALFALSEEMGLSLVKNGLKGPEDMDATRKAVTRLYIVAENLHDVGRKSKDSTLLLSATKLKTLCEKILASLMVEGLANLFETEEAPSGLILPKH